MLCEFRVTSDKVRFRVRPKPRLKPGKLSLGNYKQGDPDRIASVAVTALVPSLDRAPDPDRGQPVVTSLRWRWFPASEGAGFSQHRRSLVKLAFLCPPRRHGIPGHWRDLAEGCRKPMSVSFCEGDSDSGGAVVPRVLQKFPLPLGKG